MLSIPPVVWRNVYLSVVTRRLGAAVLIPLIAAGLLTGCDDSASCQAAASIAQKGGGGGGGHAGGGGAHAAGGESAGGHVSEGSTSEGGAHPVIPSVPHIGSGSGCQK